MALDHEKQCILNNDIARYTEKLHLAREGRKEILSARASADWKLFYSLSEIDKEGECLSLMPWTDTSKGIVRRTLDGRFAVIEIDGPVARIVKTFSNCDRARQFNCACSTVVGGTR